jgi:hypothetical protein
MTGVYMTGKVDYDANSRIDVARQALQQLTDRFHSPGGCAGRDQESILLKQWSFHCAS